MAELEPSKKLSNREIWENLSSELKLLLEVITWSGEEGVSRRELLNGINRNELILDHLDSIDVLKTRGLITEKIEETENGGVKTVYKTVDSDLADYIIRQES